MSHQLFHISISLVTGHLSLVTGFSPFLPFTFSSGLLSSGFRSPLFAISHFTSPIFTMALGAYDGWETPLLILLILLPIGIWLAALIDIIRSRFKNDTDRLLWIVVVTLAPFIGVLLYWILGKRYKIE